MVLYVYRYSKEEAAKWRESIIENCENPIVKKVFDKYPQLKSAMFLVAQYFDDEASDAVHTWQFFSVLETPDIEAFFEAILHSQGMDQINLPELSHLILMHAQQSIGNEIRDRSQMAESSFDWDIYWKMIPAFAAFCKEGCHHDMMPSESYSPYAILRRQGGEIEVEVIGKMLRPWLDGFQEYSYVCSEQQVAEWLEGIFQSYVVPVVKKVFDKYPQVKSALLLVAQYWNSEANDAVRERLASSVAETPDIDAVLKLDTEAVWKNQRQTGRVSLSELQIEFCEDKNDESVWEKIEWVDNGKAIAYFTELCKDFSYYQMIIDDADLAEFYDREACPKQMNLLEAYSPYAILRRKGEEIEVEVIGEKLRSQLNGIKPEERSE